MSAWQPIATAPKDGSEILVWHPNDDVHVVSWDSDTGLWYFCIGPHEGHWDANAFEYWMPRPERPAQ